jgi:hypothetical protein
LAVGRGAAATLDRLLDPARDRVDCLGVFADRLERAVLAPAGDIRDRVATDVEPDRGTDDDRGRDRRC